MRTIKVVQGSPEWFAFRQAHFTASDAPAMMGTSPYLTRNDLLRLKATGDEQQFDDATLARFAEGHRIEARARPIAERIIGDELYPVTALEDEDPRTGARPGKLSASFDGVTMLEHICWECKQWSESKADLVRNDELPPEDKWQVVHQLAVNQLAHKLLYMVTDGTKEKCVYLWILPNEDDIRKLRDGWALFQQDLENYAPVTDAPKPTGRAPETLPSLSIKITGKVIASNLDAFKTHAVAVFGDINTNLQTDQDFADAEQTVKWCSDIEARLQAAKDYAQGQMQDIDALFRAIDDIRNMARDKRLDLKKLVESRKQAIRDEILQGAKDTYTEHVRTLNDHLPVRVLTPANCPQPDFATAMKGKRTVKSLRDAVDNELTNAKLSANATAERVRENFQRYDEIAADHKMLFADVVQLVLKAPDDFEAAIKFRIAENKARVEREAQAAAEQERERIRREEAEKLDKARAAPSPAAATAPAPRVPYPASEEEINTVCDTHTLKTALLAWKNSYGITPSAYNALVTILAEHGALRRMP